jgi:hypothetical protein
MHNSVAGLLLNLNIQESFAGENRQSTLAEFARTMIFAFVMFLTCLLLLKLYRQIFGHHRRVRSTHLKQFTSHIKARKRERSKPKFADRIIQ